MPPIAKQDRYNSLDCIVVDGGPDPRILVVLCHGYGAGGDDLAGLSLEWTAALRERAESIRFVFPAAPLTLEELGMPNARAWWPINMAALAEIVEAQDFEDLHNQHPPGIDTAAGALCGAIDELVEGMPCGEPGLVLGGFSQGAMLTMDVSLRRLKRPPKAVLQFSGTLICQDQWKQAASRLGGTPVLQSHGTLDPILPFAGAEALRDLLTAAHVPVDFHAFPGPHTIDAGAIAKSARLLGNVVDRLADST